MLDFKEITLEDRNLISDYFLRYGCGSSDYTFTNIYAWQWCPRYMTQVDGRLVIQFSGDGASFLFPVGGGPLRPVLEELIAEARRLDKKLRLHSVTASQRAQLEEAYPGLFHFHSNPNYSDYIYSAEKLSTLAGKKLHGKRNHIHRFLELGDWEVREITPENIPVCQALNVQWTDQNQEKSHRGYGTEGQALDFVFQNYCSLGLEGILLYLNGQAIGFTIGENASMDTYVVHFEKARADIQGAYPMLNREFVRFVLARYPQTQLINREEDMGLEGIRRAKQSYYPEYLLEKFTAVVL